MARKKGKIKPRKKAHRKAKKKTHKKKTANATSNLTTHVVDIRYEETGQGKVKIGIDTIKTRLKDSGEQIEWKFHTKGAKAICRIQFDATSPFGSDSFGPVTGGSNPSSFYSGECSTSNTGTYKYSIEIIPSSKGLGGSVVIDPEVEVWDDSPPPDSDY